ncbi:hypothetical protein BHM03_00025887 [Ensete ventricosum]|nr:hypothetical protein BHM03_00025887 [Ensete ventricosum]
MVKAAGPVDGDVEAATGELPGGADGGAGVKLVELVDAIEDGAVAVLEVKATSRVAVVHGRGIGGAKEGNVVVGVEVAEVALVGGAGRRPYFSLEMRKKMIGDGGCCYLPAWEQDAKMVGYHSYHLDCDKMMPALDPCWQIDGTDYFFF